MSKSTVLFLVLIFLIKLVFSKPTCCENCGTMTLSTFGDEPELEETVVGNKKQCIFGSVCFSVCNCQKKVYFDFSSFINGRDLRKNYPKLSQEDFKQISTVVYLDMWKVIKLRDYENDPNTYGGAIRHYSKQFCQNIVRKFFFLQDPLCGGSFFTKRNWKGYSLTLAKKYTNILKECLEKGTPPSGFKVELKRRISEDKDLNSGLTKIMDSYRSKLKTREIELITMVEELKNDFANVAVKFYFDGKYHPSCNDFRENLRSDSIVKRAELSGSNREIYDNYWNGFFEVLKNHCIDVCKQK